MYQFLDFLLFLGSAIAISLALYTWRRRFIPGAEAFSFMMMAFALYSLASGMVYKSSGLETKLFWTQIGVVGLVTAVVNYFFLAVQYTQKHNLIRPTLFILMLLEPVTITILLFASPLHVWLWKDVRLAQVGQITALEFVYEPTLLFHFFYSNLLILISTYILAKTILKASSFSRYRRALLLAGIILSWVFNILYMLKVIPSVQIDLTPLSIILSAPLLAWGLFSFRLVDLVPAPYDAVFENVGDGLVVLDSNNCLTAVNQAARMIFAPNHEELVGCTAEKAFECWPLIKDSLDIPGESHAEISMSNGAVTRYYDLHFTPLYSSQHKHSISGRLVVAHEVTRRKSEAEAAQRRSDELAALHQIESQRRQEADTLRQATAVVAATLNQEEAIERILEQLAMVVPYDSASVQLKEDGRLEVVGGRGWPDIDAIKDMTFQIPGDNPNTIVIESRQPLILSHTSEQYHLFKEDSLANIRSWMGVPLIVHDHVIGMLAIDSKKEGYFTQDHARLASAFASQVAIVIENSRLYSAERQRREELEALRATQADISAELDLPKLLQAVLERSVSLLNAHGGELGLYDEDRKELKIIAGYQMGRDYTGTLMKLGEGVMGRVAKANESLIISDYESWEGRSEQYYDGPWHAIVAAPMLIGGHLLGVIGVVDTNPRREFTDSDQRLLTLFAQQTAIAVENARLYQSARQSAERRETLHRASQEVVTASLDPEGIYAAIHRAAATVMPCEAFAITLHNEPQHLIDCVYIVDHKGRAPTLSIPENRGLSGHVISTGQPLYIEDILEKLDSIDSIRVGDKEEVRSIMAVPMRLGTKVIGSLSAQSYQPSAYGQEDLYELEMLASYAAIALDNARLFREVQQLAITDSLTGVYNRRHLFEQGQREFTRSERFERPLSIIFLDIDKFKHFNDTYGHSTGDIVLKTLTQRIQASIREIDILGRYGGEEFVVVLPETRLDAAMTVAERLRQLACDVPIPAEHGDVTVTLSLGVTELNKSISSFEAMVARADAAMYDAKNAGRNRVCAR